MTKLLKATKLLFCNQLRLAFMVKSKKNYKSYLIQKKLSFPLYNERTKESVSIILVTVYDTEVKVPWELILKNNQNKCYHRTKVGIAYVMLFFSSSYEKSGDYKKMAQLLPLEHTCSQYAVVIQKQLIQF